MILAKNTFFSWSIVADQMEDRGHWMHSFIIEDNRNGHGGQSYWVWVMKMGRIIIQNMEHIRHTPVTIEHYLGEQIAKTRAHILVTIWVTDLMNHCHEFYYPYMNMNQGTYMRQISNNGHSDDSSSDRTSISMDPQQDNAGVNDPIIPILEDNTGTKMLTCHEVSLIAGIK